MSTAGAVGVFVAFDGGSAAASGAGDDAGGGGGDGAASWDGSISELCFKQLVKGTPWIEANTTTNDSAMTMTTVQRADLSPWPMAARGVRLCARVVQARASSPTTSLNVQIRYHPNHLAHHDTPQPHQLSAFGKQERCHLPPVGLCCSR